MFSYIKAFERTNSHGRTTPHSFFNEANVKKIALTPREIESSMHFRPHPPPNPAFGSQTRVREVKKS